MKQALEALESAIEQLAKPYSTQAQYAITSLRQAIARAEHLEAEKQEAVAMQMDVIVVNLVREGINKHRARELAEHFIKHTHPQPKREWVGLTDKQYFEIGQRHWLPSNKIEQIHKEIDEAAHGIKK